MLPRVFILQAIDYHDFTDFLDKLNQNARPKYKYKELGQNYHYYALFWSGEKPSERDVAAMVKENKISLPEFDSAE